MTSVNQVKKNSDPLTPARKLEYSSCIGFLEVFACGQGSH
jgi:hypothetical protein